METPVQSEPPPPPVRSSAVFWFILLLPTIWMLGFIVLARADLIPQALSLDEGVFTLIYVALNVGCFIYSGKRLIDSGVACKYGPNIAALVLIPGIFFLNIVVSMVGCGAL